MTTLLRRRKSHRVPTLGFSLLVACDAFAHPGHGVWNHGVAHALTNPVHLGFLAGIGGTLLVVAFTIRNATWRKYVRYAGLAIAAVATALWLS